MMFRNSEPWKIVGAFALIGLVAAGASYAYAAFYNYDKPTNALDIVLMCASAILFRRNLFLSCASIAK